MRGQKTPGSGRQRGTPNRYTRELRAMAQEQGPESIAFFVAVRDDEAQPIQARLYAANELLNRGYGRPSQDITVQAQAATDAPDYFSWLPEARLRIISLWLAEAKAAMGRGDKRPSDVAPPRRTMLLPRGPVIDVEPVG